MYLYRSPEISISRLIHENFDASVPTWHKLKNSATVQLGLLDSQPFTNNPFHFLTIVELAIYWQLFQRTIQIPVRRRKARKKNREMFQKHPVNYLQQLPYPMSTVHGWIAVLQGDASRWAPRSLPANNLRQSSRCFTVSCGIYGCAPRHKFNMDDSACQNSDVIFFFSFQ